MILDGAAIGGYGKAGGRIALEFPACLFAFLTNQRMVPIGGAVVGSGDAARSLLATVSPGGQTGTAGG